MPVAKSRNWNFGPHRWLIDIVAPPQTLSKMLAELQENVFKGEKIKGVDGESVENLIGFFAMC